jgi:hypothetical protein
MRVTLVTFMVAFFAFVAPSYGAEECAIKAMKETIYGKPWSVEQVQGEEGKWWVTWGDEKIKWEPQWWQQDILNKTGPGLYIDYANKSKKYPFWPYNVPDSEFEKLSAKDIWDYYYIGYVFHMCPDYTDDFWGTLEGPKGNKYASGGMEWVKRYRQSAEYKEGDVEWKYIFMQTTPEDVAGASMLQIVYCGDKTEDNFVYAPTTRKVRRLASASRQDFLPRTVWRNEDNGLCKPIHNYKITGTKILPLNPKEWPGYDPDNQRGFDLNWKGEDRRQIRGYGEPCLVMEVTPYRDKWWFGKSIYYVGAKTHKFWWNEAFDQTGRLIRRHMLYQQFLTRPADKDIPEDMPFMASAPACGIDYKTGYYQVVYIYNQRTHEGIPDDIFQENTLTREVSKKYFWR